MWMSMTVQLRWLSHRWGDVWGHAGWPGGLLRNSFFWNSISSMKGWCGDSALEILVEKLRRALKSLLYDDITYGYLPGDYTRKLRKMGIGAYEFKVIPRMTVSYNNRDHREILVIDGRLAILAVSIWLTSTSIISLLLFGHSERWRCAWKVGRSRHWRGSFSWTGISTAGKSQTWQGTIWKIKLSKAEVFTFPMAAGLSPFIRVRLAKQSIKILSATTMLHYHALSGLLIMTWRRYNAAMRGVDVRIVTPFIPVKADSRLLPVSLPRSDGVG